MPSGIPPPDHVYDEWEFINAGGGRAKKRLVPVGSRDVMKDRFPRVRPWADNIMTLRRVSYINASPIPLPHQQFIACQAPLPATAGDFWCMVLETRTGIIVTLANLRTEAGAGNLYWPSAQKYEYRLSDDAFLVVAPSGEKEKPYWIERRFLIQLCDRRTGGVQQLQECLQLEYKIWPDHGVPEATTEFRAFLERFADLQDRLGPKVPCIVHCLAGVGRTGTFIVAHALYKDPTFAISRADCTIKKLVITLREFRPFMVQTIEQYAFLHQFAQTLN
eukprot:Protomagalhaensia_sp_Gyna_25__1924@NODE_201_length_4440_cov_35_914338_g155_i0_p3_GENE_NODE_201_length_4440_cov_35_914338_g155_i0NODE_201_length_4440_cov_35_914338_g155_i0_p3_ORF_typecomplete_len276_score30_63Y_phosphatase/PF00102_27/5_5e47DSPc/PF00782_20/1_3e06CDKN3/PF05706_12/5_9e06Y_phosphatase3/PF13350_6/4_2e05PTPlike_phytase/PF14566_6/0_00022_NODE_201_length_4440_cov_35_914338_g155_i016843